MDHRLDLVAKKRHTRPPAHVLRGNRTHSLHKKIFVMTGKLVAMLAPEKKATYQVAFLMFPTIVFATKSLSSERGNLPETFLLIKKFNFN